MFTSEMEKIALYRTHRSREKERTFSFCQWALKPKYQTRWVCVSVGAHDVEGRVNFMEGSLEGKNSPLQ